MKKIIILSCFFSVISFGFAQSDSVQSKLITTADFRFRLEQDWDSRKTDGTYREDRTRMRYRLRAGFKYQLNSWASFGARLRTGNPRKQQDPQLTLGKGDEEFGTLAVGFEKAYFEAKKRGYTLGLGKNTFPFEKNNELFWSDNVFPEGVYLKKKIPFQLKLLNEITLSAGQFIIASRGSSLDQDSYLQAVQLSAQLFDKRLNVFPSFYRFKNVANIPDGGATFLLDYAIVHTGLKFKMVEEPIIYLKLDFYQNVESYENYAAIPKNLQDERRAIAVALSMGELKQKGDWTIQGTYTHLERYAAVDFLTQNDWARWDYSAFDSPDGRLTNLQGVEVVGGYKIENNIQLIAKYYLVEQLISYGNAKETGSRFRIDIDVKF